MKTHHDRSYACVKSGAAHERPDSHLHSDNAPDPRPCIERDGVHQHHQQRV